MAVSGGVLKELLLETLVVLLLVLLVSKLVRLTMLTRDGVRVLQGESGVKKTKKIN